MTKILPTGIIFGIAALVAFVAGLFVPIPFLNYIIAFGSVLVLGVGAGYSAAKAHRQSRQGLGYGAAAGAIAGITVLLLSVIVYALLSNTAFFQQALIDAAKDGAMVVDANTADPTSVDPGAATWRIGMGGAFCLGMVFAALMFAGGAIGGLLGQGVPSVANTGAGAYGSTDVATSPPTAQRYEQRDERNTTSS